MSKRLGFLYSAAALFLMLWVPSVSSAQEPYDQGVRAAPPVDYFTGLLKQGRSLRSSGAAQDAYAKFAQILHQGDEFEGYYQEAQYALSLTLIDLGLFQAALSMIENIVEQPSHASLR